MSDRGTGSTPVSEAMKCLHAASLLAAEYGKPRTAARFAMAGDALKALNPACGCDEPVVVHEPGCPEADYDR